MTVRYGANFGKSANTMLPCTPNAYYKLNIFLIAGSSLVNVSCSFNLAAMPEILHHAEYYQNQG